jgi:hypothetical protein
MTVVHHLLQIFQNCTCIVQNTAECSAGMVAHTALAAVDSLHHYPSSKIHQYPYRCSGGGWHSVGTSILVCTSYTEAPETDAAAMLAKRQIKKKYQVHSYT